MEDIPKDIIARASRHDLVAFREIYDRTSVFVYNVALGIAGNTEDAEEITQDVFIKAYKNLYKFNFRASLQTWLYRVTVNTAINHKRSSEKYADRRVDYETVINTVRTEETARDSIARADNKKRLYALLGTLGSDQRACIVLREIEGMNYGEIANTLKLNINTVRTRLKRARERLLNLAKRGESHEMRKSTRPA